MKYVAIGLGALALLIGAGALVVAIDAQRAADDAATQLDQVTEDRAATVKRLRGAEAKLRLLEECLPELRSYVDAIELEQYGDGTLYVISNGAISRHCSPVVGYFGSD